MRRNVFDSIAPVYDEILPAHVSSHYLEKRLKFFSRYLKANYRILDVGCGTGRLIAKFSENSTMQAYGCDNSLAMLKSARKRSGLNLACCASDNLPYAEEMFDIVILVAVLHHLCPDNTALKTIAEMVRVAKKGGKVIIWDANSLNPYWQLLFRRIPHDRGLKRIMPLRKIIAEAKNLHLSNIEVFQSGWVPDFAPRKMLLFFKLFEYIMERTPLLRAFAAHNVIVLTK